MIIAGQWEVIEPLGEGGMGMVYKVRHFQMQEIVLAVKMLSPELMDNQALLARFHREGAVMARFRHKHIVRVFSKGVEYDESIKRYFILMEYIQGKTLRDHLRDLKLGKRKPFALPEVVEIARQVADALAHAHNQTPPIVHRDIKPGNIMLEDPTKDFPFGRAVVMDWGIAKELKDSDDTQLTGMWTMVGTPKYCSPEQMRPLEALTGSADIYSLGMVVYELYTGKQFFADLDTESVVRRVRDDPAEHEPHFDRPAPPEFASLVRRAIAKSRSRRYQRVEEFLRDVELCRGAGEEKTATTIIRPTPGEAEGREEQRRRLEEQQRAITLDLQREALRARERAAYEGAEEGAAAAFRQAVQQEEEGAKRLGERNYFLAQDAYNEAIRLFERAREEAVAAAQRRAELARDEMAAVKREAERYRARERARRFYTSGLAFENEAGELWEQKRYRQAADGFAKAKSAFEDARELAAETLRNDIAATRERAEAGYKDAVAEKAAELAPSAFAEAERQTLEASEALEREDFTLAQQLYEVAARQYGEAQQQARAERQRRQALAELRRAADEASQRVRDAREAGDALRAAVEEQWAVASQWERQGEEAYRDERYEDARRLYEQAAQGYEQAREQAEQLRRAADEARTHAEQARAAALHAQAQEYAEELCAQGEAARQAASGLFEAGRYGQAADQYQAAVRHYQAAKTRAEQALQLQARALEQQQLATQARRVAVTGQADRYAADLFDRAQAVFGRGEQCLREKHWTRAGEAFAEAEALFTRAGQETERGKERARAEAEAACDAALGAQREAVAGERLFPERWAHAAQALEHAAQALTAEDYPAARDGFVQATGLFRDIFAAVREVAEREALKAAAEAAREHAEKGRDAAVTAGGAELAPDLFGAADARREEADAALAREAFVPARELYEDAARQYAQARQSAQAERQRLAVLAAQRQAADDAHRLLLATKADGEAFRTAAEAQWEEAQQWEARGVDAYRRTEYEEARYAYEQAAHGYTQVKREGEQAKQRAQDAKAQAMAARQAARGAVAADYAADLWRQGEHAWGEAEREEQEGRFGHAAACYDAARRAFEAARTEAAAAHRRHEQAREAKAHAERARQGAMDARAEEYARARCEQAVATCAQAETCLGAGQWEDAKAAFTRAQALFEQARREAEAAKAQAYQETEQAREDAFSARQEAESGKALFPGQWTQAQALCEQAAQAAGREEYGPARALFAQAATQFRQVLAAAQRRAADDMRQQLVAAKTAGEELQKAVEEWWADAQQWEQHGEEAYQNEQYDAARGYYEQAARGYREAQAEGERRRQAAEAAHAQAVRARRAAEEALAGEYARDLFQQGHALQRAAEQGAAQQRYGDAAQQYTQAAQRYEQARAAATEGRRLHEEAVVVKRQVEQARQEAVQARAEQYAPDPFAHAHTALTRGEQALAANRWGEAGEQLAQALESFARARQEAEREKERARQEADAARREAVAAREAAASGERLFAERWAEGQALLDQAGRALAREDYPAAQAGFRQAHALFQRLHQEALVYRQKEQAERARARAHELRHQTATARGKPKRRADKALASGDALLRQGKYTEAQTSYEEAVSLLTALQQPGVQEGKPTAIPGPAVLVSGGALAFGVAIALYWAMVTRPPAPVTPDEPVIARQPAVPDENTETQTPKAVQPPVAPPQEPVAPSRLPETTQPLSPAREDSPQQETLPPASGARETESPTPTPPQETVIAKAPPPPEPTPPVSPLPRITQAAPDPEKVVTVKEGQKLAFAIDAEGANPLRYTWFLDGKRQAEGKKWTYQPGFNDAGERVREVKAVISDGRTSPIEQSWKVRVQDVNQPPVITRVSPRAGAVELTLGETTSLTVQAADPDTDDRLTYVWSMDGREMRRGTDASWQIPETIAEGQHQVMVEVMDQAGLKSQVAWNVTMRAPAQPPRITDAQPRDEKVVVQSGTPLDFSVTADVVGGPAAATQGLTYQWSVNNGSPQKTDAGRFRFTETRPGTYRLTAVAVGPGGVQSAPRAWTVEVRARVVSPPPPVGGTELTEAEVRDWLEKNYRQAWEGKDVDALVRLGVVPSQEAGRLKAILSGYKSFRVALRDVDIQKNGRDKATVKFTRVDTVDGRPLAHPPMQLVIEKLADGRITRR